MYHGEKFNSITHLVGALFALAGGAVLVTVAVLDGNVAKIISAYDEAADFFARALGVIEGLPGAGAVRRYDLWMARARALIVSGNRREMRRSYSEALAAARELGDTELLAHAALGLGFPLEMAPVEGLVPALEEAAAGLVDQETPLRALVMARLAAWLSTEPAAHARAEQLMKDALALAGRLGDAEAQGHALMTWVMSHRLWGLPDPEERLAASTEMIGLAEAGDDPFPIMFGHFLRTDQLLELAHYDWCLVIDDRPIKTPRVAQVLQGLANRVGTSGSINGVRRGKVSH